MSCGPLLAYLRERVASWRQIARRIRVPLGFLFAILYIWLASPNTLSLVVGWLIALGGLVIRGIASGHVTKNERLTTSGPYAYVRNPLYFGSVLMGAGFAVAARSWPIVAALTVFFVVIYLPVIRSEEDFLREKFPEFTEYAQQVPRFVPRLSAFGNVQGGFSWQLYRKHREYNAVLGASMVVAALAAKMIWLSH